MGPIIPVDMIARAHGLSDCERRCVRQYVLTFDETSTREAVEKLEKCLEECGGGGA